MPEYRAPGVYVEEVPSGLKPIEGVPTSIAGFVGTTERGPCEPTQLTSLGEFGEIYGWPAPDSFLAAALEGFFANGGERCHVARVVPARAGGAIEAADYIGDRARPIEERTGLAALEAIDEIALVSVPDEVRRTPTDLSAVTQAAIDQCERTRDRFCIVSAPGCLRDLNRLPPRPASAYAAYYYPWIEVRDPASGKPRLVPPGGHVAGLYARVDRSRGVHESPANEVVHGALGLEFPVNQAMQEALNPLGVNSLREFPGRGILVWGARTLSPDPEWRYVAVRRLFLFLEESIDKGTQWVVFEPNGEPLWARVRQLVEHFLLGQWRAGALQGATPEDAFFVRCDRSTMTQNDIDNGRLVCLIGVAPVKPAEFVIFRIGQFTAEA